ncbi:MAG: hypothetical protein AAF662_10050 [Pseudomonadota bacterium]
MMVKKAVITGVLAGAAFALIPPESYGAVALVGFCGITALILVEKLA